MAALSRIAHRALPLLALVATLLTASASLAAAADVPPTSWMQFTTTAYCRNHGGKRFEFEFYTRNPPFADAPTIGIGFDASTYGSRRIYLPYAYSNGTVVSAAEGFDPCAETTCAGIGCDGTTYQYSPKPLSEYATTAAPLSYGQYQADPYRCECRYGRNKPTSLPTGINIDPSGPAAEKTDAVCASLRCSDDAATNVLYYLSSTDGTEEGCQCCKKNPSILAPVAAYPPQCGDLEPLGRTTTTTSTTTTTTSTTTTAAPTTTTTTAAPTTTTTSTTTTAAPTTTTTTTTTTTKDPNARPPPGSFIDYINAACPAGTTDGYSEHKINKFRDDFCCHVNGTNTERRCGNDLLGWKGPHVLRCSAPIGSGSVDCCAKLQSGGGVVNIGRYCSPDAVAPLASTVQFATGLVAAVLAVMFVAF